MSSFDESGAHATYWLLRASKPGGQALRPARRSSHGRHTGAPRTRQGRPWRPTGGRTQRACLQTVDLSVRASDKTRAEVMAATISWILYVEVAEKTTMSLNRTRPSARWCGEVGRSGSLYKTATTASRCAHNGNASKSDDWQCLFIDSVSLSSPSPPSFLPMKAHGSH